MHIFLGCKQQFFIVESFMRHLASSHQSHIVCSVCDLNIPSNLATSHMLGHSIGIYECVYCEYGTNSVAAIRDHMCNLHSNKLLYVTCRVHRKVLPQPVRNTNANWLACSR